MNNVPQVLLWDHHQPLVDETAFTPWADEGWNSWNGQSPEQEVCVFVQALIRMMEPELVLETGVGQGYMTRAIVAADQDLRLVAYESDQGWRQALWTLPFWADHRYVAHLSPEPTPCLHELEQADLCVFDSEFTVRFSEIERWQAHAKPRSVAVIHDTSNRKDTIHASLRGLIGDLGITGVFFNNPRGCFMAVQPGEEG